MNTQIKRLLEQSGLQPYYNGQEVDIAKFAELLIRECAIIANRAENTETELRCMYDVITEHFGVE